LYANLKYLIEPVQQVYTKQSAIELLLQRARERFGNVDAITTKSQDQQVWIQSNVSDKIFLNKLMTHAKFTPDFPVAGVSSDGTFIFRKFSELRPTKWKFVTNLTGEENEIQYTESIFKDRPGFINSFVGYGRQKLNWIIEDGQYEKVFEDAKPYLANADKLSRRADVAKKFAEMGIINDNVDPDYWDTALHNMINWFIFSSEMVKLSFTNKYKDIRIFDPIEVYEDEVGSNKKYSAKPISGNYIVTKVARNLSGKKFATHIEACRETVSEIQGNLR